jgi:hypothetical protein
LLTFAALATLLLPLTIGAGVRAPENAGPALAHMVFFALKDHSKDTRDQFVASCQKHLAGHEGAVYFSVGTIAEDVEEPVSVKDFDVALHVVFASKEAKAKYLESPRHKQFVEENKASFAKVRVFDSYLAKS